MATEKWHEDEIDDGPDAFEARNEAVQKWAEFAFYVVCAPAWIFLLGMVAVSLDEYGPFVMLIPSVIGAIGFIVFIAKAVRQFIPAVDAYRDWQTAKWKAIAEVFSVDPPRN